MKEPKENHFKGFSFQPAPPFFSTLFVVYSRTMCFEEGGALVSRLESVHLLHYRSSML